MPSVIFVTPWKSLIFCFFYTKWILLEGCIASMNKVCFLACLFIAMFTCRFIYIFFVFGFSFRQFDTSYKWVFRVVLHLVKLVDFEPTVWWLLCFVTTFKHSSKQLYALNISLTSITFNWFRLCFAATFTRLYRYLFSNKFSTLNSPCLFGVIYCITCIIAPFLEFGIWWPQLYLFWCYRVRLSRCITPLINRNWIYCLNLKFKDCYLYIRQIRNDLSYLVLCAERQTSLPATPNKDLAFSRSAMSVTFIFISTVICRSPYFHLYSFTPG